MNWNSAPDKTKLKNKIYEEHMLLFISNARYEIQPMTKLLKISGLRVEVEKQTTLFSNIRIFGGQSSGNTARHAYSQEQQDYNSNSNTGSSGSVANDELFKFHGTSSLVDFVCTSSTSFTTAFCKDFAASVRNVIGLGESSCVFPISVTIDTATSKVALHDVPSFGHSIVLWLLVIFQAFFHSCGDDFSGVSPKDVDCNGDSD